MINETKIEMIKNARLAFRLDFFSDFPRKKLAKFIIKGTKIDQVSYSNEYKKPYNMEYLIRVCRNDFGGNRMSQIQTDFLPYYEAIDLMFKLTDIIAMYGYTDEKCNVTVSVKLNSKNLGIPRISSINTIKLLSSIDDLHQISKKYSDDHEKMYMNSLMYIYPENMMLAKDADPSSFIDFKKYKVPTSDKFVIDYSELNLDAVTVNFFMRKNYEKNKRTIYNFAANLVNAVYNVLKNNTSLNGNETSKVSRVCGLQRNILQNIWDYNGIKDRLPKIEIIVDIKDDETLLKTYYSTKIREKLFQLIAYCGMDSGTINYDTARDRIQVRDANLVNAKYITGVEFFYSSLIGDFTDCVFYECDINESVVRNCEIMYSTNLKGCRVFDCSFHGIGITLDDCFVSNPEDKIIEGDIKNSVLSGVVNYSSPVDGKSELLKKTIIK